MEWSFSPNEAIDAIVFCNAVSRSEKYSSRYPGLRETWARPLGADVLHIIDEGMGVSMSGLAQVLSTCGAETLDDVVHALRRWDQFRPQAQAALGPADKKPEALRARDATTVFVRLSAAGWIQHWRAHVLPELEREAAGLRERAGALPLDNVHRALSAFLGDDRPPAGTRVRLAWYIQPIAFQLPDGAMATHPDDTPDANSLGQLCVHESLHGFPGSEAALAAQGALISREPEFARYHDEFVQRWLSGPEEHLVTGAEAYLTEMLKLRTRQECVEYLQRQNGGMPFARAVYERLRDEGAAVGGTEWPGFGAWAAGEISEGRLRWPDHLPPAAS